MKIPVEKFINIPFLRKGRTMAGCDCWGLVRLVYAYHFGVWMPSYTEDHATAVDVSEISALIDGESKSKFWRKIDRPEPGDIVTFKILSFVSHVGLCLGRDRFLHVMKGTNSTVERLSSRVWEKRVEGFYRHEK